MVFVGLKPDLPPIGFAPFSRRPTNSCLVGLKPDLPMTEFVCRHLS